MMTKATAKFPGRSDSESIAISLGISLSTELVQTLVQTVVSNRCNSLLVITSNSNPSASEAEVLGLQIDTGIELREQRNLVAPTVALRMRKPAIESDAKAASCANDSDGFAAALLMIAKLPLSDAEKAESVRRLLNANGEKRKNR